MNAAILIATFGDDRWSELAWSRAYPSALAQGCPVVVYHGPTDTLAGARNHAATLVQADWLCYVDADDELEPGYMAAMELYQGYGAPKEKLLAPSIRYAHDGVPNARATSPAWNHWPNQNICCIGTLYRREFFLSLGGFRELPSLEDYDLALRAVKAGAVIVPSLAAVYRAHVTPGSRNSDQSVYEQLRAEHAEVWER